MIPQIHIQATNIGRYEQGLQVKCGNRILAEASDVDYESNDACKCCELLAAMRDAGLIELNADDAAKKCWSALANKA
jgi:hypothetical protein